jgi:hypothetical protein
VSRRPRKTRRSSSDVKILIRGVLCLAVLVLAVAALDAAEHLALLAVVVAVAAGGFAPGRRYGRRRARGGITAPRVQQDPRKSSAATTAPFPADQVQLLEQLAGRPFSAILASYERVARYHHGSQP